MAVSDKAKALYLIILIFFVTGAGVFWLDNIGMIDMHRFMNKHFGKKDQSVLYATDDEPSLIEKEEFEKEKEELKERIEDLDRREALIVEKEKAIQLEKEKTDEIKRGLDLEKRKLDNDKNKYSGYKKNILDLASKVSNMPPDKAVEIMIKWEDTLIIDVLRQMDQNAADAGKKSITPYMISLMPKEKSSRIMYLMTQL